MATIKTVYRNRFPHIAPIGATFFVTFRLADSLPWQVVKQLKLSLQSKIDQLDPNALDYERQVQRIRKRIFLEYEHQLDQKPFGYCHLKQPDVAEILKAKLHELDDQLYDLFTYCIMPNHVHLLFSSARQLQPAPERIGWILPEDYKQLYEIMRQIKGSTAYYANKVLKRSGTFWQKESYDHYVRNEGELFRIARYILQNPVKAGLVKDWKDFPHTYLADELVHSSGGFSRQI